MLSNVVYMEYYYNSFILNTSEMSMQDVQKFHCVILMDILKLHPRKKLLNIVETFVKLCNMYPTVTRQENSKIFISKYKLNLCGPITFH